MISRLNKSSLILGCIRIEGFDLMGRLVEWTSNEEDLKYTKLLKI